MADFLGKYELRAVLGKGAMGTVYEGFDPLIARQVAIKTVRLPDADDLEAQDELARFKREAQAAGRLSHPNIVGVFDYGETPELAYIVMEFVDGTTLKHLTDKRERFELAEVARLMSELMAGLQYSHDRGVVHRDIKPANIMLTKKGEVKIADFGIARIESSSMTQAGTMLGTPSYMSPEQFMGQTVDARTDIYSSGVLLYQLLTGDKPFEGSLTSIMHKVINTEPPAPSALSVTVPGAFDAVVKKAMAKRPEDRFANATAFTQAVRAALEAKPALDEVLSFGQGKIGDGDATLIAPSRPASPPPATPATPRKTQAPAKKGLPIGAIIGVIALLLLAAGGGAYVMLTGKHPATPTPQTPITPQANNPPPASTTPNLTPPPTPAQPPPPGPPRLNFAQMATTTTATFGALPCTLIAANLTPTNGAGALSLTGISGAGAPEATLTQAEQTLPHQITLQDSVQRIDGPYCDALNTVRPYSPLFLGNLAALSLTGGNRTLHNTDAISINASLPPAAHYIQIDYFQGDGTVYHPGNPKLSPGQSKLTQEIGTVSAPYGTDLMLTIASSTPLFPSPRKALENDSDYLPALHQALQTAVSGGAQVSVSAIPVTTAP